jgi:hypothetical protein
VQGVKLSPRVVGQRKVRGPLEAALAGGERLYGQSMALFDLAVVDEAHGTAGDIGRPWAAIHDNQRIRADFRLYLTATPRILASPRLQRGKDGQELEIASMTSDPNGPYGDAVDVVRFGVDVTWMFGLCVTERGSSLRSSGHVLVSDHGDMVPNIR